MVVSARSGIVRRASSPAVGEIGRRAVSASFEDIAPHLHTPEQVDDLSTTMTMTGLLSDSNGSHEVHI